MFFEISSLVFSYFNYGLEFLVFNSLEEGNLIFMKNYYHKVANIAIVSVCAAVGLVLGVTKAVKAVTLGPTIVFHIEPGRIVPNNFDVVAKGPLGEAANFAEYNLGDISLSANTAINRAVFETPLHSVWVGGDAVGIPGAINPGRLGIFGYVGNGAADASDFQAGTFLSSVDISSFPPLFGLDTFISFDVTNFVQTMVYNNSPFAGFGIRALNNGAVSLYGNQVKGKPPKLILETITLPDPKPTTIPESTIVPEPTTVLGSIMTLGIVGLLKRKKFKPAK
jgi:hypothetical protein